MLTSVVFSNTYSGVKISFLLKCFVEGIFNQSNILQLFSDLCSYSPLYSFPQLCSGVDENAVGTCAELIFAPIDASFADDAPLLPSGFRIIPLDSRTVSK